MLEMNALPALALGELPLATPTPDLSTSTPISTPTPNLSTPTPLPSILPSDSTPPVISGVLEASLLSIDATIVWMTDELAVFALEYGTTTSYGSSATLPATALLAHTGILLNLLPSTTYYYCIHATDLSGNTANSCGHSFVTASTPVTLDANPPTISDISISSLTATSATINWTTEEVANGEIQYGLTPSYGSTTPLETPLSLNHTIVLSGLTADTLYHYRIQSSDEIGNLATSPDNTFTTEVSAGAGAGSGLVNVSAVISGVETAEITFTSATIAWQTDIPSDSQVEYGDSSLFGQLTTLDATLSTSHSVTITGLPSNTNYYFRVKSKLVGVSVATVSSNHDFNTLSEATPSVPYAQILSVSVGSITTTAATVSTTTDIGATARVEYGITTEYGQISATDSSAASHTIALSDLEPGTLYHYRVKAVSADGDVTFSEDYMFTTLTPTVPVPPPSGITDLSVAGYDDTSVTLAWDVAYATADAAAEYDIRYSTTPITSGNFSSAAQAEILPIVYEDVVQSGTRARVYIIAGLAPATQYYFALKSKYEGTTFSDISNVVSAALPSAAPVSQTIPISSGTSGGGGGAIGPISEPSMLNASGDNKEIVLNWKNPGEYNYVRTVIVKKAGSYPTSPTDGQVIFEGRGETFTDTNLINGTTYYYAFYAYDHAKNYSSRIQVSLAPRLAVTQKILYENPEIVAITPANHFVEILKRGIKDIEVEHLQEVLARDESLYPEKLITGYFGTLTEQALKKFQQRHNLPQTGITDVATQAKLSIVSRSSVKLEVPEDIILFTKDLSRGSQGDDVAALQKFLIYEGSYTAATADGVYGPSTVQAVKTFQKKYGVRPVSGYFGVKTRHKVRDITGL